MYKEKHPFQPNIASSAHKHGPGDNSEEEGLDSDEDGACIVLYSTVMKRVFSNVCGV